MYGTFSGFSTFQQLFGCSDKSLNHSFEWKVLENAEKWFSCIQSANEDHVKCSKATEKLHMVGGGVSISKINYYI